VIERYEGSGEDWERGTCPRCLKEDENAKRIPLAFSGTKNCKRMNMNKNAACREVSNCTKMELR
jgi:hypothetical protein